MPYISVLYAVCSSPSIMAPLRTFLVRFFRNCDKPLTCSLYFPCNSPWSASVFKLSYVRTCHRISQHILVIFPICHCCLPLSIGVFLFLAIMNNQLLRTLPVIHIRSLQYHFFKFYLDVAICIWYLLCICICYVSAYLHVSCSLILVLNSYGYLATQLAFEVSFLNVINDLTYYLTYAILPNDTLDYVCKRGSHYLIMCSMTVLMPQITSAKEVAAT